MLVVSWRFTWLKSHRIVARTALHVAAFSGDLQILQWLLSEGQQSYPKLSKFRDRFIICCYKQDIVPSISVLYYLFGSTVSQNHRFQVRASQYVEWTLEVSRLASWCARPSAANPFAFSSTLRLWGRGSGSKQHVDFSHGIDAVDKSKWILKQ